MEQRTAEYRIQVQLSNVVHNVGTRVFIIWASPGQSATNDRYDIFVIQPSSPLLHCWL